MNPQLRDIHGLDPLPWWPPAAGWWLTALLLALALLLLALLLRQLIRYPPGSWRRDAYRRLARLQRRRTGQPPKQTAAELSRLLRRIAMARFGRPGLARLSGEQWLDWLRDHDPNNFDWRRHGQLLLRLPYAPAGDDDTAASEQIGRLISAAQRLVADSRDGAGNGREARGV